MAKTEIASPNSFDRSMKWANVNSERWNPAWTEKQHTSIPFEEFASNINKNRHSIFHILYTTYVSVYIVHIRCGEDSTYILLRWVGRNSKQKNDARALGLRRMEMVSQRLSTIFTFHCSSIPLAAIKRTMTWNNCSPNNVIMYEYSRGLCLFSPNHLICVKCFSKYENGWTKSKKRTFFVLFWISLQIVFVDKNVVYVTSFDTHTHTEQKIKTNRKSTQEFWNHRAPTQLSAFWSHLMKAFIKCYAHPVKLLI